MKKNIETVQGADVYPAGQQMLIHQGKVLKDGTTLDENKVAENSFIVIMLSKVKISMNLFKGKIVISSSSHLLPNTTFVTEQNHLRWSFKISNRPKGGSAKCRRRRPCSTSGCIPSASGGSCYCDTVSFTLINSKYFHFCPWLHSSTMQTCHRASTIRHRHSSAGKCVWAGGITSCCRNQFGRCNSADSWYGWRDVGQGHCHSCPSCRLQQPWKSCWIFIFR